MDRTWLERVLETDDQNFTKLSELSESWNTCAVGEQKQQHPELILTWGSGCPSDEKLRRFGLNFHWAIRQNYKDGALVFLRAIEDRVLEMKRDADEKR